jgi:hypothetical protein
VHKSAACGMSPESLTSTTHQCPLHRQYAHACPDISVILAPVGGWSPLALAVTAGHAVKAMVLNGLGFVNQQFYIKRANASRTQAHGGCSTTLSGFLWDSSLGNGPS